MFRRPSQKRQLVQRVVVSTLAMLAIIIGVTLTVLFILGYRLDSGSGRLEQGALLQFDSSPDGADVWADGVPTGLRTGSKQTVIAGEHTFTFRKDRYNDWSRTLDVKAGTLTWLDYARLVPKDLPVEEVQQYASLAGAKASPDRKTYIIQEKKDSPVFSIVNLRSENVTSTTITLPETVYGADTSAPEVVHEFTLRRWDEGSRYALITHHVGSQVEWIVVDTRNVAESKNLTKQLGIQAKDVQFAGTDGRSFYGLMSDGAIRKLDLGNQTISRTLVTGVESFTFSHTTKVLSYVGADADDATRKVAGVYRDGDASSYVLRSAVKETPLAIATGLYHGNDYIAIAEGGAVSVLRGAYPRSIDDVSNLAQYSTISLDSAISWLSFSEDGDFLIVKGDATFVGYEVEHKRSTVASVAGKTAFDWLDEAYVWDDTDGVLTMRDFNGTNVSKIMNVAVGFDATLSQNGRFFYAIGTKDGSYALQRVKMILD